MDDNLTSTDREAVLYLEKTTNKEYESKLIALPSGTLGKPLSKRSAVQMEFCQIAFQPPHPQANVRCVGTKN